MQHRLISQLEPSIADKAVLGDEFWSYQKDRRLEYISMPNSLELVDKHPAATTLLLSFYCFAIILASQLHINEDGNPGRAIQYAMIPVQSSRRASTLKPSIRTPNLAGGEHNRLPRYLPHPTWSATGFSMLCFNFYRKLRAYDIKGDDLLVP